MRTVNLPDAGEGYVVEFKNVYDANGTVVLNAKKKLQGGDIGDGQFTFRLFNLDDSKVYDNYNGVKTEIVTSTVKTVANNGVAEYTATFPAIHYTLDDLKNMTKVVDENGKTAYLVKYYMTEDHPTEAYKNESDGNWYYHGMVYDGSKYWVEVYV